MQDCKKPRTSIEIERFLMNAEDAAKVSALMAEVEQLQYANDLNYNALKVQTDKTEIDQTEAWIISNTVSINHKRKEINTLLLDLPF